jgi:hypothetical protein
MRKLTKTRNVIENLLWSWDALIVWSECFRLAAFFLILSQNNQVYLLQLRNKQKIRTNAFTVPLPVSYALVDYGTGLYTFTQVLSISFM